MVMEMSAGLQFIGQAAARSAMNYFAQDFYFRQSGLLDRVLEPLKPFLANDKEAIRHAAELGRLGAEKLQAEHEGNHKMLDLLFADLRSRRQDFIDKVRSMLKVSDELSDKERIPVKITTDLVFREKRLSWGSGNQVRVLTGWGDLGIFIGTAAAIDSDHIAPRFVLVRRSTPPFESMEIRLGDDQNSWDSSKVLPGEVLIAGGVFNYAFSKDPPSAFLTVDNPEVTPVIELTREAFEKVMGDKIAVGYAVDLSGD